jgi:S-adenosylmethionine hydrolase
MEVEPPMITLTSDFGIKDSYVSQMKGTILSINPKTTIVDITHEIEKFNVQMGAFILSSATPFFPKGTVHLAVVDPGVGTERRAIIIQTKQAFFVGPDNGVLMLSAKSQGIKHIYQITNSKLRSPTISNTFHGRDIFAPAAAYLDSGIAPSEFGPEITEAFEPKFASVKHKDNSFIGEVLHVDGFGNLITNIKLKELASTKTVDVKLPNQTLTLPLCTTYGQTPPEQALILVGSHGFLEIAINQGNASEKFQVKAGYAVKIRVRV